MNIVSFIISRNALSRRIRKDRDIPIELVTARTILPYVGGFYPVAGSWGLLVFVYL